jgi:hypothetical protein
MIRLRTAPTIAGLLAVGAVLASPAGVSAKSLSGTVVHASRHAHSLVIADARGRLHVVHVAHIVAPSTNVRLSVHRLRNGTLGAKKIWTGRRAPRARVHGRVTYISRARSAFVISVRGASLLVHRRHHHARAASAAAVTSADGLPALGSEVTVSGTFDRSGALTADTVTNDGQHDNHVDLEGVILSVDSLARTITISADDNDELAGAAIVIHLPSTFDMTGYKVGDVLLVVATLNPDGSYTAVDTFGDGGAEEADEQDCQQSPDEPAGDLLEDQQLNSPCEADPAEGENDGEGAQAPGTSKGA